jgi:phage-related protein
VTYSWEWIDPDGTSTALWVEYSVKGAFGPPATIYEEAVPGQPGARFREARHEVRELTLPLYLYNDDPDPSPLHTQLGNLVRALDPTRGEGVLRVTTPVGDVRDLGCRAASGLSVDHTIGDAASPRHQRLPVVFRALDPYWYATSPEVREYVNLSTSATFFPIFPIRLVGSEVFATDQINNVGDVDAWPVWDITGPGSDPIVRNVTTNKSLSLNGLTLASGEVATIDTRPGQKTITRQDGVNLFTYAVGSLWPLQAGNNSISLEMGTADLITSRVRLEHKPRWRTL